MKIPAPKDLHTQDDFQKFGTKVKKLLESRQIKPYRNWRLRKCCPECHEPLKQEAITSHMLYLSTVFCISFCQQCGYEYGESWNPNAL